jgi:hypothetical protein
MATTQRVLYVARRRDGSFRGISARSWRDAKRYFGAEAVSIRKRLVSHELECAALDDFDLYRAIYFGESTLGKCEKSELSEKSPLPDRSS